MKRLLVWLLALLWLLEELLWDGINWLEAKLSILRQVRAIEAWVAKRSPWQAAFLMLAPGALLVPAKLAGVWLLARGHVMIGVASILAAKLIGTAIVARMYKLCRHALLTLAWFAWCHAGVMRIRAWVHASEAWHTLMQWKRSLREQLKRYKAWWARRMR